MSDRSPAPSERPSSADSRRQAPPPDAVEFIRFCHRRRHVGWPELYDEMCAVAARREFNGWDHEQLAEHGLTFALYEMPRLAAWVRAVIGPEVVTPDVDHRAIVQPAAGTA
ncbi:MAG TPA: hypothetical protein VFK61_07810 [Candidatus Limnocylindria bacterium]|jgi:hypothetical protein|nr:hypothetical protein [Candidatus Limnocylindria bacterium]